jgi:protein-S-isoprenylcysteine O-methyltransferase Ste14
MSTPAEGDRPGVVIFPPLLFLIAAAAACGVHWVRAMPLGWGSVGRACGVGAAVAAPALALWALASMRQAGTNVNPSKPAVAIVVRGPYRFTRNPMYLALCLLLAALGLLLDDASPFLFLVPMGLVLHYGVILREERYLELKFGGTYLDYKGRVRRWV